MVDPAKTAEALEVRTFGRWTDFRLPTALLWVAVAGGMMMLYLSSRLAAEQLRDHERRITVAERVQQTHADQPGHERSARVLLLLDERLRELEAEGAAE